MVDIEIAESLSVKPGENELVGAEPTPAVKINTVINSLVPTERKVAELILTQPEVALESTAQELAEIVGVGRSTVIRACQSFGYKGYLQLRVALAKQLAVQHTAPNSFDQSGIGQLAYDAHQISERLPQAIATVDAQTYDLVIQTLNSNRRILCVGHGLSTPIALDLAMRLSSLGKQSEFIFDPLAGQITARHLNTDDSVVVISGSGASDLSLRTANSGKESGAKVIAITSFASSPLVSLADYSLVISPITGGFQDELEHTGRVNHFVLINSLINSIQAVMGEPSLRARARTLEVISENLSD